MPNKLLSTSPSGLQLEIETLDHRRYQYLLPFGMSQAACLAFLCSPHLESILSHLEKRGSEKAEGLVVSALHKLALELMGLYPASLQSRAASAAVPETPSVPLARIAIRQCYPSVFVFCTSYKDVSICREEHVDTLEDALVAALFALPPEAMAVEVAFEGWVTGTYPRALLERDPESVVMDAKRTRAAIDGLRVPATSALSSGGLQGRA